MNNIVITVTSISYVFAVVAVMDFAVKKGFPQYISRKVVHIAAGSWIVFWLFYNPSHWSKYLNIAPALIWTILLIQKGLFADADDEAVKTMTRTGDRKELLKGPLYFTIVMNIMGTFFFYSPYAVTAMSYLGWGDGIAPVIGQKYGKIKFKILSQKSIEGSIGFFIFGLIAACLFNFLLFGKIDFELIFVAGIIATLVEAASPGNVDNLLIPAILWFVYHFFN